MSQKITITPLSTLHPPSLDRTWLTIPHPRLPLVATCSSDKSVRIYSLSNFTLLSTISGGHKRSIRTCAWKPGVQGESVLATGSFDATVAVWRRWDSYGQEKGGIGEDGEGEIGDGEEAEEDEEWRYSIVLEGHDSEVKSLSWSPSGSLLASCSRDKSIWLWEDLDDGDGNFETVAVLQEHTQDVKCVAWHPVEECLASGSYDDTIRLWREDIDDWGQVACLRGHEGTVWYVDWEGVDRDILNSSSEPKDESEIAAAKAWNERQTASGPRLVSCSDDHSVRIWRRQMPASSTAGTASTPGSVPSIIRPTGTDEAWIEEAVLPPAHGLAVYAVAWSKKPSGRIASTGADGRIVVYQERLVTDTTTTNGTAEDAGNGDKMDTDPANTTAENTPKTEWTVLASVEAAHGVYEVNHICWAKRADQKGEIGGGDADGEEEVLLTTADDGQVKVWRVGADGELRS
ncbi:Cytosolic iron-sulfur protein assembly protein [Arachnomyces sp. PD_36]|nr:Cytosolic iron-sulfur protein assembly protein [Arachnomyces sp. PD_36]